MKQKRIRINLEDADGAKFKFDIEGNVTKDKVLKLFELMDLMNIEEEQNTPDLDSIGGKIWNIIENSFPTGRFTSSTVLEEYEDEYNKPIKLSVVSTYLARFASRNKIQRTRVGREWSYQIIRIAQKHQ
ncbi:MAG: hypothetical protein NZ731_00040 [Gammaproteobacteria bacterium]|jgi:hypothetical protein|uniref:Uncharacterized protein n=1 Tax=marine metagenome TaxID=408172 RepID=A0A381XDI8_9ZZZZ|nr:hypothetical protein [Gammaproteobacteria bacterium]NWJ89974.1 hypothetical protein [Marine Group I thaumarchaeote]PXF28425.1 MAG: hypothetical protein CXX67_00300 [Nitrososphaerota archaeon]HIC05854.1 hypothetical protein [Candidatus Nitrosopelagicus sp.]|tara:strand:+ start:937 stop:1323 length:387 start_codon:yes stop_codon:yes gene_type:complete